MVDLFLLMCPFWIIVFNTRSLNIVIIVYCTKLLLCLRKGLSSLTIRIISHVKKIVFWDFESTHLIVLWDFSTHFMVWNFEYPFGGFIFEPTWLMGVLCESKSCICVCTCTICLVYMSVDCVVNFVLALLSILSPLINVFFFFFFFNFFII